MPDVITIGGSPSAHSKSAALLDYARQILEKEGLTTAAIGVRDLPAQDLLFGNSIHPAIVAALSQLASASAVIVATPIYKAAYTGVLKTFLDLLPQNALAGKYILPLATGGSPAHALAIDYALKPVLAALGARQFLNGVYLTDSQIQLDGALGQLQLQPDVQQRLHQALHELLSKLPLSVK